ncbi:aminoglycoside adenylyltransferase domain-containing protein [Sporosarcina sp. NPDC096371]|uniref:aminoglycoside adenylyltransferase domain-containing protein n=1 Tax=Sporosarcina sp. NPDC096371 TaxID=3364530 RepID=UPI0038134B5C
MGKLPVDVEKVLDKYISMLHERLPNSLEGFYLQGSIALDAYVDGSSDIDFIAIINRRLSEREMRVLSEIHRTIANTYPKPEMDGVYLMWADIGKLEAVETNYPFYNGGKLGYGVHYNAISWWILKTNGINILGPEPTSLNFKINTQHLISYVVENMNSYWTGRIQKIELAMEDMPQLLAKEIDDEIEWSVLGLLRQYYTLKEHGIISKLDAGEYALLHLPEEWHPIIQEAIDIRNGAKRESSSSDRERMEAVLRFSKYIIDNCNSSLIPKTKIS